MANDGYDKEPSPFLRPMFILSAAFLTVVAVLAAFVVWASDDDDPPKGVIPQRTGEQAGTSEGRGGCRPVDTDQRVPTAAPPGVSWQVFKGVALPFSSSAGPMVTEGDVVRCYARTPVGALIAMAQTVPRVEYTDGWRQVVNRSVVPGPGQAALLRERTGGPTAPTGPGNIAQYAGFKIVTYSQDVAVFEIAVRVSDGRFATSVCTVRWVGGDWKLELKPDGSTNSAPQVIDSLDSYVPWGGV
jgi:hypothetical protein